jgi:N-acetylglucosamine malate deacetylase 1
MNVLIVAAHPDDEVLGCGATISRHVDQGDRVDILIIGDGVTSRYQEKDLKKKDVVSQVQALKKAAMEAGRIMGASSVDVRGHLCCRFEQIPLLDITKIVEAKISECKPSVVYTHGPNDANNDHNLVFKAVQTATRPVPGLVVKEVLLMEVLSSTEYWFLDSFRPDIYVDVSNTIDRKLSALKAYSAELRPFPYPRSEEVVRASAIKRGSEVGVRHAEAFRLLRSIR